MDPVILPQSGIACAESGSGPPAVLLHCSASSAGQWRDLRKDLETRFHVLAPDLHGHGKSDPWAGPTPPRLCDEAAIVTALTERVREPIHLVGHSYGGAVALCFARAYPERLRSLVLIEPVAFHLLRQAGREHAARLAEVEQLADAVTRAADKGGVGMERFVDFWSGDGAWSRLSTEARVAIMGRAGAVAGHFVAALGETTPCAAYGAIAVPTLIIRGTESPAPIRPITVALNKVFPKVRMLDVRGAGHMLPLTHAGLINSAIIAHLSCPGNDSSIR